MLSHYPDHYQLTQLMLALIYFWQGVTDVIEIKLIDHDRNVIAAFSCRSVLLHIDHNKQTSVTLSKQQQVISVGRKKTRFETTQ